MGRVRGAGFFIGRCGVYACDETHAMRERGEEAGQRWRSRSAAPAVLGQTTLAVDSHLSIPADGAPSEHEPRPAARRSPAKGRTG
jgi:hypothetical protein